MSYKSSDKTLDALFCTLLEDFHPTAEYIGYLYIEHKHFHGFEIYYKVAGSVKYMSIDTEGNRFIEASIE